MKNLHSFGITLLACLAFPVVLAAQPGVIRNNTNWMDTEGNPVFASMGGHITLVGDTYYWVGSDPRLVDENGDDPGFDIRLYSSKTLGSDSWKFETMIADLTPVNGRTNSTLLYNRKTDRWVVVGKGISFYVSETNDIAGSYRYRGKVDGNRLHPGYVESDESTHYDSGGMSAYREGDRAYIIVSMNPKVGRRRWVDIFELTDDFLGIIPEPILSMRVDRNREAFWLFKRDGLYYMTYDGPGGWKGSDCYYRTSTTLSNPDNWSGEVEIGMNPVPTINLQRSHASQHRWIMKFGDQWVYGGDRYPNQEPESHPPENGLFIMCPIDWDGIHPTVRWEEEWTIDAEVKPFRKWANLNHVENGPDRTGDKMGDEDGDGMVNLVEFALGGNPLVADAPALRPSLAKAENGIEVTYRRRKAVESGVSYIPQVSADLLNGSWIDAPELEVGTEALDDTFERVTAELSPSSAIFFRLEVSDQ